MDNVCNVHIRVRLGLELGVDHGSVCDMFVLKLGSVLL